MHQITFSININKKNDNLFYFNNNKKGNEFSFF